MLALSHVLTPLWGSCKKPIRPNTVCNPCGSEGCGTHCHAVSPPPAETFRSQMSGHRTQPVSPEATAQQPTLQPQGSLCSTFLPVTDTKACCSPCPSHSHTPGYRCTPKGVALGPHAASLPGQLCAAGGGYHSTHVYLCQSGHSWCKCVFSWPSKYLSNFVSLVRTCRPG